ncbi:transposase domain DUF772-containing protein [Nitzschia inconspicua]|uniref:Transposase domain DUF772-containing protein n=1 Tax=Nitzschia inconspicua TaxID=303405 RepID=A0A9K3LDD7_9STRA|nr:transposase domain DUF772-containing protein [Nitzschia inconspicua]
MDAGGDVGWGDLFAKAAELGESTSKEGFAAQSSLKKNRKRKHGSQREIQDSCKMDAEFRAMLDSRMDPQPDPSLWYDGSLLADRLDSADGCSGWRKGVDNPLTTRCQQCEKPFLYHRLQFQRLLQGQSYNGSIMWPLPFFSAVRNIRCSAKIIVVLSSANKPKKSVLGRLEDLVREIIRERGNIENFSQSHMMNSNHDEVTMLVDKLHILNQHIDSLRSAFKGVSSGNQSTSQTKAQTWILFPHLIRIIMACDACYYRLYYMQLIGVLPVWQRTRLDGRRSPLFLPHPQEHFKGNLHSISEIRKHASEFWDEDIKRASFSYLSEDESSGIADGDHSLARIYQYRYWETVELFFNTGWSQSVDTRKLVEESMDAYVRYATGLSKFETPAPRLLAEWRDSCRDFMCNIFAYATLPPKTLASLQKIISQIGIRKVIDHGAGTGYIARLIHNATKDGGKNDDSSLEVEAWDMMPQPEYAQYEKKAQTSTGNEYHGATPAFFHINQWESNDYLGKLIKGREKSTALLLCYPPPQSSMALDVTKAFLKAGGSILVHIGEFKGLTGNDAFEKLLLRQMTCIERFPTFNWGTDASFVSLWSLAGENAYKDGTYPAQKVLLPCTTCSKQEATKRCRLDRTLVYCSDQCFRDGSTFRTQQLRMQMIENDDLQFLDPGCFDTL